MTLWDNTKSTLQLMTTMKPMTTTGRLLRCQVEHHVRDKFATPILYGIDNFIFHAIFFTYTEPFITSFVYFF